MKVRIDTPFYCPEYQRLMVKGEIVDGSEKWVHEIENDGLGKIIQVNLKVQKRKIKILNREIETASVEASNEL